MTDEWDRPASVGHLRGIESRVASIDDAVHKLAAAETEAASFRAVASARLRELAGRRWWPLLAAALIGYLLGRLP